MKFDNLAGHRLTRAIKVILLHGLGIVIAVIVSAAVSIPVLKAYLFLANYASNCSTSQNLRNFLNLLVMDSGSDLGGMFILLLSFASVLIAYLFTLLKLAIRKQVILCIAVVIASYVVVCLLTSLDQIGC